MAGTRKTTRCNLLFVRAAAAAVLSTEVLKSVALKSVALSLDTIVLYLI